MIKITKKNNLDITYSIIENNYLFYKHSVIKEAIINSINELPMIEELLIKDGYYFSDFGKNDSRFIYNNDNLDFVIIYLNNRLYTNAYIDVLYKNVEFEYVECFKNHLENIDKYIIANYKTNEYQIKKPDFKNSLVNLASSFQKKFGQLSKYPSIGFVDELIKEYDKVTLLLLDGLGINILNNLAKDGFLNRNKINQITSIFPPTTVAATTCVQSGLLPGESGWIGWNQYFKSVNKNIVLFKEEDYYTGEKIDSNIISEKLGYKPYYDNFSKCYKLMPHFMENGYSDFSMIVDEIIKISNINEKSFTYAYWDSPDNLIHEYGCFGQEVKERLIELEKSLEILEDKLSKDACVIITADHGLLDVEEIHLHNFESLKKYYTLKPSIEGRCCSFSVNDKAGFKHDFNKYFSSYFDLYTKDEFIKSGLIGEDVRLGSEFLGDFIAIAKSNYYINPKDEEGRFKAAHAGLTVDEVDVPFIFIKRRAV